MAKLPNYEEMARNVAEKALDEYEYNGKTLRQWIEIISASEHGTNLAEVGTDCISREQAIEALSELATFTDEWSEHTWMYTDDVYGAIKQLPTIQPDIVRCKDCKHWIPYDWMFSEIWQSKNIADYPEDDIGCDCSEMAMKANDFCSRAERRTDE